MTIVKSISHRNSFLENEAAKAWDYFQETGYPDKRQENWRFSNLKPWLFPDTKEHAKEIEYSENEFSQYTWQDTHSVFIINDQIHIPGKFPESVIISPFQTAVGHHSFKDTFGKLSNYNTQTLAAENTALFHDGLYIQIPDNSIVELPIHLIHIIKNGNSRRLFPRFLIHIGMNSQLEILESEIGLDEHQHYINSVYEIHVQENASLQWTKIQQLNTQSGQWASYDVALDRDTSVRFNNYDFGGGFVRNEVHTYFHSPGGNFELNNLFVPNGKQHMDIYTMVHHEKPHCTSQQLIKGVLGGSSSGVFRGLANVYKDAEKTDAQQTNHNLLLSSKATMNSIPQLEIYEDDVKCSHGSTTGQIEEEALFYLQSRGINRTDAMELMVTGFANEVVDKVQNQAMKEYIQNSLIQKMKGMTL